MGMVEDLAGYADTNTSLTLGTDLFIGMMPESPSNCVGVFENSGAPGMYTMGSYNLPRFERPQFQFIVRNSSYSTGRTLADSLYRLFTAIANQTINGHLYYRVEALGTPDVMDRDLNKRVLFTCNFDVVWSLP